MKEPTVRNLFARSALLAIPFSVGLVLSLPAQASPLSVKQCAHAMKAYNEAKKNGTGDRRFRQRLFVKIAYDNMRMKIGEADYALARKACSDQVLAKKIAKALGQAGKAVVGAAPSPGVSGSAATQAAGEVIKAVTQ